MLHSTPIHTDARHADSGSAVSIRRADGSTARVMAVAERVATPQDSGMPVIAGLAAYVAILPVVAVLSCAAVALGAL